MDNTRNIVRSIAAFTLFMFMSTFVPAGTADAADYTTPYSGTITVASADTLVVSADGYNTITASGDGIYANGSGKDLTIVRSAGGSDTLVINSAKEGIRADNGGTVSGDINVDITTTATDGHGIITAGTGGTINLSGVSIDAAAHGIFARNANITIKANNGHNTIKAGNQGIYLESGAVNILKGTSDALVINSGKQGMQISGGTLSSDVNLEIRNAGSHGIAAVPGTTVNLKGVSIDAAVSGIYNRGSNITIETNNGYNSIKATENGIYVTENGIMTINQGSADALTVSAGRKSDKDVIDVRGGASLYSSAALSVDSFADASDALRAGYYSTGHIIVSNDVRVLTRSDSASGVYATKGSGVTITGDLTATTLGNKNANALRSWETNSIITINGKALLRTNGSQANAIDANAGAVTLAEVDAETTGGSSHAAYVYNNGVLNVTGGGVMKASGSDSAALALRNNGTINITGVAASAPTSGIAVKSEGDNTLHAASSSLTGDVLQNNIGKNPGTLGMTLANGATLTGGANAAVSTAKINMDINASTWNVTKDSTTNGILNNAGTMDFGRNVSDGAKKVNVYDYNGAAGSMLHMKTDINTAAEMDQILASNKATGASDITIYNTANAGVERSAALLRGENGGGSNLTLTKWDEETGGVKYIHAGAWKYSLVKETDATGAEEWFLKRGDKIPPKPDPDEPEPLRPIGLTTTGQAIVAAAFLHDVWYTETNTWNKRMGIYRDNLWNGGLWFTGVANREDFDHEHDNTVADRQDFTTGTIGFDKKYDVKGGTFWGGVMAGFGKADSDLLAGIGDVDMDSYHMSLYGIYRNNNGFYVNGIVKYNDYRSELNVYRPDFFSRDVLNLDQIHGEWSQDGLGISVQAGKRFDFKGDKGWYWEPQMQFSWNRVFATGYTTDSGIDVELDDIDYIRLRGGIVLGRSWTLKNGTLLDLYADASIIHDFDADVDVTMSGGTYTSTLGGTWGIYGVGANWQFKPGQFLHARFQYSDGEPFTEPFAVYLGFSFEM